MQVWNISPEQWNSQTQAFDRFPHEYGIFVEILEEYTRKLEEIKQLRNAAPTDALWEQYEHHRKALKPPILMLWGVIASRRNRFFRREVADTIVTRAQELLQLAINYLQNFEHVTVLYGDVDSVMIQLPATWSLDRCVQEAHRLVVGLNQMLWHKFQDEGLPEDRVQLLRIKRWMKKPTKRRKLDTSRRIMMITRIKRRYHSVNP